MPKKCESCRFHSSKRSKLSIGEIALVFCTNPIVASDEIKEMFPDRIGLPLDIAREVCDKEGDGIFVYFEPVTPAAGATFEAPKTMAASAGGAS